MAAHCRFVDGHVKGLRAIQTLKPDLLWIPQSIPLDPSVLDYVIDGMLPEYR